ncbi:uncharacterized protein TNCV_4533371 [Trichonephila clavipes]|nr:uncharacterized protein TNCV_4533371 [Trichonephila clavipes]
MQEKPMHPKKVTRRCGFIATFLIGPYFFEEIKPNGIQTCSVTVKRFHDLLRDFVIPELQQRGCLQYTTFIQDRAPLHIDHGEKIFYNSTLQMHGCSAVISERQGFLVR